MKIAITAASGQLGHAIAKAATALIGRDKVIAIARTPAKAADLHRRLDRHVAIAEAHAGDGEARHVRTKQALSDYVLAELRSHGSQLPEASILDILATDLELNVQGLTWWLDNRA